MNLLAPAATWGFWILLVAGWMLGELDVKRIAIFLGLWIAGFAGARVWSAGALFLPYIAVVDIVLVFLIFKGDVRLE